MKKKILNIILIITVICLFIVISSVDAPNVEKIQVRKNIYKILENGDTIMYKVDIKMDTTYYLQNSTKKTKRHRI